MTCIVELSLSVMRAMPLAGNRFEPPYIHPGSISID
jgi:hypothetical protein